MQLKRKFGAEIQHKSLKRSKRLAKTQTSNYDESDYISDSSSDYISDSLETKRISKRRKVTEEKKAPVSLTYKETTQMSVLKSKENFLSMNGKLEFAYQKLHPTARPEFLPCREDEFSEILSHLESAISSGQGSCIYISGVPGTGKTATTQSVLKLLLEKKNNKEIPEFDYFEINGMALSDPAYAYALLWQRLSNEKASPVHAASLLDKYFSSSKNKRNHPLVLLVDELDQFVTKKQKVVYNLFEWPNRPHSQLIVVSIANTMDLPERVMLNRVSSRIGLTRLNFEPYNHQQLIEIVSSRLSGLELFESKAIELCARKVSSVSGDARRALDICRYAVSLLQTDQEVNEQISVSVINRAIKEIFATPAINAIQRSSLHQKLFLASVLKCLRNSGLSESCFEQVLHEYQKLCSVKSISYPGLSLAILTMSNLCKMKWISCNGRSLDLKSMIRLNLMEEDLLCVFNRTTDNRLKHIL